MNLIWENEITIYIYIYTDDMSTMSVYLYTCIQQLCEDTGCCPDNLLIGLVGRAYAIGPGDMGFIPGRFMPKTLKIVLDTSLLNTQQYKVRIKGKVEQSTERGSTSRTLRCSSYWKGSLLVALDYSRQLYLYRYIYI